MGCYTEVGESGLLRVLFCELAISNLQGMKMVTAVCCANSLLNVITDRDTTVHLAETIHRIELEAAATITSSVVLFPRSRVRRVAAARVEV